MIDLCLRIGVPHMLHTSLYCGVRFNLRMNAKVSIIIENYYYDYYCLRTTPKGEETSLNSCSNFATRLEIRK